MLHRRVVRHLPTSSEFQNLDKFGAKQKINKPEAFVWIANNISRQIWQIALFVIDMLLQEGLDIESSGSNRYFFCWNL